MKQIHLIQEKLGEILEKGTSTPSGYVLPLNNTENKWFTSEWEFRRKHVFLTPGTSPIGFRLPLESLMENPNM